MPKFQSAYQRHHSTETAQLRVMSDIIGPMDNQRVTLLGLLDLSAAFDCVNHEILLSRLEKTLGIRGNALEWITSFLSGRTQQVCCNGHLSDIGQLLYGVPLRWVWEVCSTYFTLPI
jgi:Reverse transcriptase (RNA-dependent DNA polymerase)